MRQTYTHRLLLALICWLNAGLLLHAQVLDLAFQPTVLKTSIASVLQSGVNTLAVQPDGKVLAAGGFDFVSASLTGKIHRFDSFGSPDPTFNVGGPGANGFISAILLQPDGKILVGGGFTTFNGQALPMVVRLNVNGTLDTSFSFGTASAIRQISSLALQPDGKILVGSGPTLQGGPSLGGLVRLLPSGALDASFSIGAGITQGLISAILVQADGNILIGGSFIGFNGLQLMSLVRVTSSGTLDPTFAFNIPATNLTVTGTVAALAQQPDGRLVVAGSFSQNSGQTTNRLVRMSLSGTMDATFQPGTGPNNTVRSMALDPSGNILIGGTFTQINGVNRNRIARLTLTGALDASYGDPFGANATVNAVALTPGGQALVGGVFTQYNAASFAGLVRLGAGTGLLDNLFIPTIEARGTLAQVVPLASGQLLIAGNFLQFNGANLTGTTASIRRVNIDGTLDMSFASPTVTGAIQAPQSNGSFYILGGSPIVMRILASGAVDNSFVLQPFGAPAAGITSILYQGVVGLANGQLLVLGRFGSYGSLTGLSGLVRLNANGTPDNTFVPTGIPTNDRVIQAAVQPSGKLIVVSTDLNTSATSVLRFNANGTIDNTFSVGTAAGAGANYSVLVQPDGRLLVSGAFTSFNGQAAPYGLMRLTVDGAPDATFPGLAASYLLRQVQSDGRILVSSSSSPATSASNTLIRLNTDGSVDNTFIPVATPTGIFIGDDVLAGVVIQPIDGKIILYGGFRYIAGQPRIGLARLTNIGLATRTATTFLPLSLYPNPAHTAVTVALPAAAQPRPATLLDLNGRLVRRWTVPAQQAETRLSLEAVAAGLYLLQVRAENAVYQQKVVVTP